MKYLLITFALVLSTSLLIAQDHDSTDVGNALPVVDLKTVDGEVFSTADISNDGKPVIISFWATWCKPCIQELMAVADVYPDWQEETGVVLYAISIDDAKSAARVGPMVNGRDWDYEVLVDINQDFKRAMGVVDPPHTFILNGKGEIVWQHSGYLPGDEEGYYEALMKITDGEDPSH